MDNKFKLMALLAAVSMGASAQTVQTTENDLFVYQRCELLGDEEFLGNFLDVFGGDAFDAGIECMEVVVFAEEEEVLAKVEGEVFAVVAGKGKLTFDLAFCSGELCGCEGTSNKTVELFADKTQTAVHIVRVATEIGGPDACVAIRYHR